MEGWKIVILTSALSLLSSIVVGVISARSSHKNDIKKAIHAKRADAYFDFYEKVEELLNERDKVFSDEYFQFLISSKAKIKLMASEKTFSAFESFYNYVREKNHAFLNFCSENDPYNDDSYLETFINEDGEEVTDYNVPEEEEQYYVYEKELYIAENRPTLDEIRSYINPLYEAMRAVLGSKL